MLCIHADDVKENALMLTILYEMVWKDFLFSYAIKPFDIVQVFKSMFNFPVLRKLSN